jgi:hypothetical protein
MSQFALNPGIPYALFSASAAGATTNSSSVAIPPSGLKAARRITWQAFYSAVPTTITIALQGSLDDSNWFTLDTTTNTGGEVKTVEHQVNFLRASITTKTGSFNTTVQVNI